MRATHLLACALLSAAVAGCNEAPPTPAAKTPPPGKAAPPAAGSAAAKKVEDQPEQRAAKRDRPAGEKAKVAQLFQIPQFTGVAANNPSDAGQDGLNAASQIRYLGFSRMEGQLKALVQVKGEIIAVEPGDLIDGVEVVAVDTESVSLQYSGNRWKPKLFERPETRPVVLARATAPAGEPVPSAGGPNGQAN